MAGRERETWIGGPQGEFRTTHWSVVVRARDPASPERQEALRRLIGTYWKPLYNYVRRSGQDSESAKDIVQNFFTALLEKDLLQYVQSDRAKFRTFLRMALKHQMSDQRDRTTAIKRGGGKSIFSLDFSGAEREFSDEPAIDEPPDQAFRREWGLRVLHQGLLALRSEFGAEGREPEFEALKSHLVARPDHKRTYADLAGSLGLTESEVSHRIDRARARYRELILQVIRSYTESDDQVQEELRDLFAALS
jgi:RNA polymerase sigma factor (sigma-70 family)